MKGSISSFVFPADGSLLPARRWHWVLLDDSTAILDSGSVATWEGALDALRQAWCWRATEPVWGGRVDRPSYWRTRS